MQRRTSLPLKVTTTSITLLSRDSTSVDDGRNVCKDILSPTAPSNRVAFAFHGSGLVARLSLGGEGLYCKKVKAVQGSA